MSSASLSVTPTPIKNEEDNAADAAENVKKRIDEASTTDLGSIDKIAESVKVYGVKARPCVRIDDPVV